MTHNERVLRLLSDGKPHSHHEGYALGVILHSRVSELRRRGYAIRSWREGDLYLYQLTASPLGTADVCPPSSASAAPSGIGDPERPPLTPVAVAVARPAVAHQGDLLEAPSEAERQLRLTLEVAA